MKKLSLYEKDDVDVYSKSASRYDHYIKLYNAFWQFFGFRYEHWRKMAIEKLNIKKGQIVVDLGCGTGLNFPYIQKKIGKEGKVIGIDNSKNMLDVCKKKIRKNKWENVVVVKENFENYEIPSNVDAVISTYALGLSRTSDKTIQKTHHRLKHDGRFVVLGFKDEGLSLGAKAFLPFWLSCIKDYSYDTFRSDTNRPWRHIKKYFNHHQTLEFFGGLSYISVGTKT